MIKPNYKPTEGQLFMEGKGGVWKSVKAVFTPPQTLTLDGVAFQVSGARHHAEAPKKQADYGIQIATVNGSFINVAATSGLEKYDWIERLTPRSSGHNSPITPKAMSPGGRGKNSSGGMMSNGSHSGSEFAQRLLEENETLRQELEKANAKMLDMRSKLKKVAAGYKDELRTTISLKKQVLNYETQLQELQKEVVILRELTGTEADFSGSGDYED
jgi:hypothetical protein